MAAIDEDEQDQDTAIRTGQPKITVPLTPVKEASRGHSAAAGLTERTVQAIVADLEAAGYLTRHRTGRRSRYTVHHDSLFRHAAQDGHPHRAGTTGQPRLTAGRRARRQRLAAAAS